MGLPLSGEPPHRQGADELVVLDVSATPEGRGHALEVVAEQATMAERLACTGAVYTTEVTYLRADGSQMPALA